MTAACGVTELWARITRVYLRGLSRGSEAATANLASRSSQPLAVMSLAADMLSTVCDGDVGRERKRFCLSCQILPNSCYQLNILGFP